jgi:HPt (histidine-containing phosphotransfer) domain-containing protein/HAMP domain-containing protein
MSAMKRLHSLRFRLTAATGLLALSLLGVSLLGNVQFSKVSRTVEGVSAETELLIRLGHTLDNGEVLGKLLAKGWADPPDVPSQVRFLATLSDAQEHLRVALSHSAAGETHDVLASAAQQFAASRTQLDAAKGKALDEIEALKVEEGLSDALGTLAKIKLATGQSVEADLVGVRQGVREPVRLFWIVAFVGLIVALLVMGVVHFRIVSPINKLVAGVRALARGEHVVVQSGGKDELAELAGAFNMMAETITDRTTRLKLVLDSTGDALIPLSLDGKLAGACSKRTLEWFGTLPEGVPVWTHWEDKDPDFAARFCCAFDQVVSDVLPFECAVDMMPKDLKVGKTIYGLSYRAVGDGNTLDGVLVVITDVTAKREAEAQEAESREVFSVVGLCFRDPELYEGFVSDASKRMSDMKTGDLARQQADLHTLKGNAGMIGFVRLAHACHLLEDEIDEAGTRLDVARIEWLSNLFAESRKRVEALAGSKQDTVQVSHDEYRWLQTALAPGNPAVASRVSSWTLARVERILDQLGGHSKRIGERLGKEIKVSIDCPDIRLDRQLFDGLWPSMVHAIRNAVDHGIEAPKDRVAIGKEGAGHLRIRGRADRGTLRLTVEDDGRGINEPSLRQKVVEMNGPKAASWPLIDIVCARGASTAEEVTETSGRGVGVGALRDVVLRHGGQMRLETTAGKGTRLDIELPLGTSTWWQERQAA